MVVYSNSLKLKYVSLYNFFWLSWTIISYRRTNELKLDINIPDDIIMKFKQFWSDFKDTPLKGKIS